MAEVFLLNPSETFCNSLAIPCKDLSTADCYSVYDAKLKRLIKKSPIRLKKFLTFSPNGIHLLILIVFLKRADE